MPQCQQRHVIDITSLSDARINRILELSQQFEQQHPNQQQGNPQPTTTNTSVSEQPLAGRTIALVFYEASTRTRVSFEMAAQRLGAHVVNVQAQASSVTKGETLRDTMLTLAAMGVDCIVLRHPENHAAAELAACAPAHLSIINAGDGTYAHPSQALLDARTILNHGLSIADSTLTIVGDIRHSRVANSNLALWQRLGAKSIRIAGPKGFLPDAAALEKLTSNGAISTYNNIDEALTGCDVAMMLRIQKERIANAQLPDLATYQRDWCLTPERLSLIDQDGIVLHPGPMNRGIEIDSSVADGERSKILEQVHQGVYVRMAMFYDCLSAV